MLDTEYYTRRGTTRLSIPVWTKRGSKPKAVENSNRSGTEDETTGKGYKLSKLPRTSGSNILRQIEKFGIVVSIRSMTSGPVPFINTSRGEYYMGEEGKRG